jgi:hypothetical protein
MTTLPFPTVARVHQPDDPAARLVVFALRRMGAHGLADADAAHAYVTAFGKDFRRPLILTRTLLAEMSVHTRRSISIAPWCCSRMTAHEATLLDVLALSPHDDGAAHWLMADMLGVHQAHAPLATATALAIAFADLGLPLS